MICNHILTTQGVISEKQKQSSLTRSILNTFLAGFLCAKDRIGVRPLSDFMFNVCFAIRYVRTGQCRGKFCTSCWPVSRICNNTLRSTIVPLSIKVKVYL